MSERKIYLSWNNDSLYFSGGAVDYVWSEVYIVIQVAEAFGGEGGGGVIFDTKDPIEEIERKLGRKTAQEFKRIVIRVNGLEKVKDKAREPRVTIKHVNNTFQHFGIKVILQDIPVIKK
jgi:hypothetical protein